MAEDEEISPVREERSPESMHSLEEVTEMPSEKKGEKRTPSPMRSRKVKIPTSGGEKNSSSASSSGSMSSSSSDSESESDSDKSPLRKRDSEKAKKSPPLAIY
jgi:hypothetical protein